MRLSPCLANFAVVWEWWKAHARPVLQGFPADSRTWQLSFPRLSSGVGAERKLARQPSGLS